MLGALSALPWDKDGLFVLVLALVYHYIQPIVSATINMRTQRQPDLHAKNVHR